ncbi:MAG: hypothetical protein V3R66_03245 [Rhodospirillales bacterium]
MRETKDERSGWMMGCRSFLVTILMLGLSACAFEDEIVLGPFSWPNCVEGVAKHIEGIDWAEARTINVSIRQDEFEPMVIGLRQNNPYIFRIENRDEYEHFFMAEGFFSSVAVASIKGPGQESGPSCIDGVKIGPFETVELRLVPVRDGRYEYNDDTFPIPNLGGMTGLISIDLPRKKMPRPVFHEEDKEAEPGPPAPDGVGPTAPVESAPIEPVEPSPFDAVEPSPFDTVEPEPPATEPSPFETVEPEPPATEPSPFEAVEPEPPIGEPKPKPPGLSVPDPFDATKPVLHDVDVPDPFPAEAPLPGEGTGPAPPAAMPDATGDEPAGPPRPSPGGYEAPEMLDAGDDLSEPAVPEPPPPSRPQSEPGFKSKIRSRVKTFFDFLINSIFGPE